MTSRQTRTQPSDLNPVLSDGGELALLDIREHGQYGEGHPFFSVNCPFSSLEWALPVMVPNPTARVVIFDQSDEGVAERAAARMAEMGYQDVSILAGGARGWADAGYVHFKGVNVPSKAFGEMVEHAMGTPSVSAEELQALIDADENMVILDGRTPAEYARMNIPTALSCPNAELGYRIDQLAPDPTTRIVINCAGRTRSIIGAQTLINLGIDNPVMALRNGTQGWQLAGLQLGHHASPGTAAPLKKDDLTQVRDRAARFAKANGILPIAPQTLGDWQADGSRTTYLFDVRSTEEYLAGHLAGAIHAPGGQLVQATDHWVAVRGARIVLTCDLGPRAVTTCYWLRAMGHDAHVLNLDVSALETPETGPASVTPPASVAGLDHIDAATLAEARTDGVLLLDASSGTAYRAGHIVGAQWIIRPRLGGVKAHLNQPIVVCGTTERATLLARDLIAEGCKNLRVLAGGPEEWSRAGFAIEETPDVPEDADLIDFLFFVHDRHSGSLESARRYLEWETGLIDQMDADERAVFKPEPPLTAAAE